MAELQKISVTKLNNENYQIWKYKMELLLIREDLWSAITTERPTGTTEIAAWQKRDDKARATLGLFVEDSQIIHIRKKTTAREVWDSLKNYHEKSTLTSKIYLLRQICGLKLNEGGDMEEHLNSMSNLVDKLTALGEELKDPLVVAMMLSSLPDSYGTLITALESRPETDLTLNLVKGKLIDEYKRRKGIDSSRESAMKIEHKSRNFQAGENPSCYFCKKPGHFKQQCGKYHTWKAKQNKSSSNKEKANQVSEDTSENYCFSISQSEETFSNKDQDMWYIDSGATSHMTSNKGFFNTYEDKHATDVILATGIKAKVEGIGSGTLRCLNEKNEEREITFKDVLYVPDLQGHLISVKRLTTNGLKVVFKDAGCWIYSKDKEIAFATLTNNLYALRSQDKAMLALGTQHTPQCQHTWHRVLAHHHIKGIEQLEKRNLATGIKIKDCGIREICECCAKGKSSRTPFPKESSTKSKAILDLVHTDVWGAANHTTPGGKRYFMTIIDDYSRFSTVYLLENKSEAARCMKQYINYVSTKFGRKPKIVRSDNGKEYVNAELEQLYQDEGIETQYTIPYNPQQNGTAERKNRTLMEAARTMLIDAGMEKKYWGEAVYTANHIQNILPTKSTNRTPYELWYDRKPDMKNLQIFGTKGYVHIPKEKRKKLDDKAVPMIFVGYSEKSKGYRMLDMSNNKITLSRDVIFINDLKRKEKTSEQIENPEDISTKEETKGHKKIHNRERKRRTEEEIVSLDIFTEENVDEPEVNDEDRDVQDSEGESVTDQSTLESKKPSYEILTQYKKKQENLEVLVELVFLIL